MKLFLGADHGGYYLKEKIEVYLAKRGYDVTDVGDNELDSHDDFPQFAQMAALKVLGEEERDDPRAILICKGGQGMAMAANRFRGIRAVVIWNSAQAKESRDDNDSNVLCLPATVVEEEDALWKGIVDTWLNTPFSGIARYKRRNIQIDEVG